MHLIGRKNQLSILSFLKAQQQLFNIQFRILKDRKKCNFGRSGGIKLCQSESVSNLEVLSLHNFGSFIKRTLMHLCTFSEHLIICFRKRCLTSFLT